MKNFARTLLSAVLVGVSLSAAILVVTLLSMLERYSKDLNEVIACWQVIVVGVVGCVLSLRGAIELYRRGTG